MKLEKEKLLNETYDKFIQISLNDFSMEGIEEFVDQKIMGYGTTVDEKILNIESYRELVIRQREQGKDIKMTFDTKPVYHRMANNENSALFVDEILLTLYIEDNSFEIFLRISTMLEYREERWIIIHWHASKPEYEEGETDTWHINEWQQKMDELERMVATKTADLVMKNRELEIEAALERVRTIAMGMMKPEDLLDICHAVFTELQSLGFEELRNSMINIHDDDNRSFLNYEFSNYAGATKTNFLYNIHPVIESLVRQTRNANEAFSEIVFSGTELDEWRDSRKKNGESDDPRLNNISALHYYFYSIGIGALGISTFKSLDTGQLEILKRFRNVFNLAYRRFKDIEQAETQAREAQIELALERIRAQAMAMKESSDLLDIVVTMRSEFIALGHEAHYFWHMRWLPEMYEKAMTSGDGTRIGMVMELPRGFHDNAAMLEWERNDEPVAVFTLDADGAIDYVDRMIRMGRFHEIDHNAPGPDDIRAIGGLTFVMARTTHGEIGYSLPGIVADPPAEDLATLVRFAGAFDLAYRRFEDLKEAEAQNKIIQVENERKTQELEEARQLQLAMLPKVIPKLPHLDIAVYMKTATEVSGDYYDFSFRKDGTLNVAIGDATGHGMKAGTLVTAMKAFFTSGSSEHEMDEFFSSVNRSIKGMRLERVMMGFAMLNINGNQVKLINAGMPPILHYNRKKDEVGEIRIHGMPLGAMEKINYETTTLPLSKGDVLLLLSDGMPELQNANGEMFGYDRVITQLRQSADKTPDEIIENLKNTGSDWVKNKDPDDDVTFVVIKIK